jgi:DNA (cytosine-5)-methyltransferase 1
MLKTMHLFAGHGGGLLADLILGHNPIVAVEWDGYACQVLRERAADGWFPGLQVWEGDVRLFDPSEYAGKVDCIHAGFPCQDISTAGKQAGVGPETRSGLYREVLRIAGVVRPKQLFLENVSAIVSNGLGTVLADLAALGYDSEWLCLRAADCGANHLRDRWWLLANSTGSGSGRIGGELQGKDEQQTSERQEKQFRQFDHASEGGIPTNVAHPRHEGACERGQSFNAGEEVRKQGGNVCNGASSSCKQESKILADTDTDSAQRQRNERAERSNPEYTDFSVPGWWQVEPELGRVANGIPNRAHRLKGLGNGQVPLQAAVAWKLLGGE